MYESTPIGVLVGVNEVYQDYSILFMGYHTWDDLVILDMMDFDIILEMSCLSPYHEILDFHTKTITVAMPEGYIRVEGLL